MATVSSIEGMGPVMAEKYAAAGVGQTETLPALARRNAEKLAATMTEIDEFRNLTRRVPSVK